MIRSLDEASTLRKDSKREAEEKNFLRNENRLLQEQVALIQLIYEIKVALIQLIHEIKVALIQLIYELKIVWMTS